MSNARSGNLRRLGAIACLVGACLACAGLGLADELYALVAKDLFEEHDRVELAAATPTVLMDDIGITLRLSSALVTRDGTDLLLFGQAVDSGVQYFWRVGRTGAPGVLNGPYQAIMGGRLQ